MSSDEEEVVFRLFRYQEGGDMRQLQTFELLHLNYMASRVRAALFRWETTSSTTEEAATWWWQGFQNEMVRHSNILIRKRLPNVQVDRCDGNRRACLRRIECFH
jgi:hypothetical protein